MPRIPIKQGANELAIPPGAIADAGSSEVLRAWIVDKGLHVSLVPGFDSPDVWGVMLCDIARHAARAFAADGVSTEREALSRIRKMFDAEWGRPTDRGTTSPLQKQ